MQKTFSRIIIVVTLGLLASVGIAQPTSEPPRKSLKVAKRFDLSGSSKSGWNDFAKELTKKGVDTPIFVIAHTRTKDDKGVVSEAFRTILGKQADLDGAGGSVLSKTKGAPVSLRQGFIHTLVGSGKGEPYSVDISEERFAPTTMYSMHHYPNTAIVEFEEDEGAKTWKAKVDILAKPLTRADTVRLF